MYFSSVQLLSRVRLFATPWIAAHQASLSITNSRSSPRLTSNESVMPSSHLILCRPLFLLPLIPPSIRVLSNESTLRMRWPKYWSFSFSILTYKCSVSTKKDSGTRVAAWHTLEIRLPAVLCREHMFCVLYWYCQNTLNILISPFFFFLTLQKVSS